MLYSPNPCFVTQMADILTKKRYQYARVFVDYYSGYSYLHLQKTQDVDEAIDAKSAFEEHARQHGIHIRPYHADNSIFRANKWV